LAAHTNNGNKKKSAEKEYIMETVTYRVSQALIPPVILAMGFGLYLLYLEAGGDKFLLMCIVLAPFFYLGVEILARRILIDDRGITVCKFLRSKRIEWSKVEHVDAVTARQKVFVILQDKNARTIIITNTIDSFKNLVDRILDHVEKYTIVPTAIEVLANPPAKRGPVIQAWLACIVIVGVVIAKLLGYGG
jgi:hypothetical protein